MSKIVWNLNLISIKSQKKTANTCNFLGKSVIFMEYFCRLSSFFLRLFLVKSISISPNESGSVTRDPQNTCYLLTCCVHAMS